MSANLGTLLNALKGADKGAVLRMFPKDEDGFVRIPVGKNDATAAKLLEWLMVEMGDEAKTGELLDVLDWARWWFLLHMSLSATPTTDERK